MKLRPLAPTGRKPMAAGAMSRRLAGNEGSAGNGWASRLERSQRRKNVLFRLRLNPSIRIKVFCFVGRCRRCKRSTKVFYDGARQIRRPNYGPSNFYYETLQLQ